MIFRQAYCIGEIKQDPNQSDIHVHGTITEMVDDDRIMYLAAAPPDYRTSYTGSALPFQNADIAFHNTPNKGEKVLRGNRFDVDLLFPNSYYEGLGRYLIPPTLYVNYKSGGQEKTIAIQVSQPIPYRRLTYPESRNVEHSLGLDVMNQGPSFYKGNEQLPIRTQERILRQACYPTRNIEPEDHWGLKPRC